jgi:hypothetical protein
LALGALAAAKLCAESTLARGPLIDSVPASLLAQQNPETGGFHTHFQADTHRLTDPNVETTAVTLLALHALLQNDCRPETVSD